jgi:hypothetical protein
VRDREREGHTHAMSSSRYGVGVGVSEGEGEVSTHVIRVAFVVVSPSHRHVEGHALVSCGGALAVWTRSGDVR